MSGRRVGLALVLACMVGGALVGSGAAGGSKVPKPAVARHSLTGTHEWYPQTYQGRPVIGGYLVMHEYRDGHRQSFDRRKRIVGDVASTATVSSDRAADIAKRSAGASVTAATPTLAVLSGMQARLVWAVVVSRPTGHERVFVDATTGDVRGKVRLAEDANGSGRVFDPNPIVTLRDRTLFDQDDADYPALAGAYRNVTLTHLDGSGYLRGDYAEVGPMDDLAFSPSLTFNFGRSSPYFEQTMSYYQVTRAQEYIQSLGFTGASEINDEPQNLFPDVIPDDNAFYDSFDDSIVFGTGGVDEAEDADIIWHEYGHAMQGDQFRDEGGFPTRAMLAVGEGFGDYWAVTMSQAVNNGFDVPCFAEWGSDRGGVAAPDRCDRRADLDLTLDDRTNEPHHDGQIWSRALWDINQALGRDKANRIILEAQFGFDVEMSFADAAIVVGDTAKLLYGSSAKNVVNKAFAARGILTPGGVAHPDHPLHPQHPVKATLIAVAGQSAPGGGRFDTEFEPGGLTKTGAVSFNAELNIGGQFGGEAAYLYNGKTLVELGRSGDTAPGGGIFSLQGNFGQVTENDAGDTAFTFMFDPVLLPLGINAGAFLHPAGAATSAIVRGGGGTPAPGGRTFLGATEPVVNGSRWVSFTGLTDTDLGYTPGVGSGVFLSKPGSAITTVAAPGDPVPGGGTIDYAGGPSMNAAGDVAYAAHVVGDDLACYDFMLDCAASVFVRRGGTGSIETVAREGTQAPGSAAGVVYEETYKPLVNDRGDVLFFAFADGFFPGLYLRTNGVTQRIFGDQTIPGIGDVVIGFPNFRGAAPGYAFNNRGQVVFNADVYGGPDGPFFGRQVLMLQDGKFGVVAAPGSTVNGVGTIADIREGVLINDNGQVLMQVVLDDGRVALLLASTK